ncbi:hypothetical protein A2U01_0087520, partial [Trifolium medium]|nr:hypothetical protein [Trifolium medium]
RKEGNAGLDNGGAEWRTHRTTTTMSTSWKGALD